MLEHQVSIVDHPGNVRVLTTNRGSPQFVSNLRHLLRSFVEHTRVSKLVKVLFGSVHQEFPISDPGGQLIRSARSGLYFIPSFAGHFPVLIEAPIAAPTSAPLQRSKLGVLGAGSGGQRQLIRWSIVEDKVDVVKFWTQLLLKDASRTIWGIFLT